MSRLFPRGFKDPNWTKQEEDEFEHEVIQKLDKLKRARIEADEALIIDTPDVRKILIDMDAMFLMLPEKDMEDVCYNILRIFVEEYG